MPSSEGHCELNTLCNASKCQLPAFLRLCLSLPHTYSKIRIKTNKQKNPSASVFSNFKAYLFIQLKYCSFTMCYCVSFLFFFCLFRATPTTYGGSQARGLMGAVVACLHQSHSNQGSEPHLQPTGVQQGDSVIHTYIHFFFFRFFL